MGDIGSGRNCQACGYSGIQQSKYGVVKAVASRDKGKAETFATETGVAESYGSYEELLHDPEIEAIYIPLPNHLHKEWTIRAAHAGKHVLCEKPIALNAAEAAEMEAVCRDAGVVLAEAFMYRHHPRYEMMKQWIRDGAIGDVRGIHGTFTFNGAANSGNIRFRKDWGGGSIYDVGVYPISAARLILESEPEAATVHAFFSPDHDDVDMMASGLLEFPNCVAVTFDCGMWAHFRNTLEVLGTQGRIEVPSAFVADVDGGDFFLETAEGRKKIEVPKLNQYAAQVDDFAMRVRGEKPAVQFEAKDAVLNMHVVDACLQSARERKRIQL